MTNTRETVAQTTTRRRLWLTALIAFTVASVGLATPTAHATAGDFVWARQLGSTGSSSDFGEAVAVDAAGNVYTVGYFDGTGDFDPGAGVASLTTSGTFDAFVSKVDAAGNFLWARKLGGAGDDRANSVAVDAAGNVYTVGFFGGTADFDPGAGTANLVSIGNQDGFVSKLDTNGSFVWARQIGSATSDFASTVAVDSMGNVYAAGTFSGVADFDPGAGVVNLTPGGGTDSYVLKLDSGGLFVWAKQFGSQYVQVQGMTVDNTSNVYFAGLFIGPANDFDPGPGTFIIPSAGVSDGFVVKLNATGDLVWARAVSGTATEDIRAIEVDPAGNVYATGYTTGTADLDPGVGVHSITTAGDSDAFVIKLDSSGVFVWARQLGSTTADFSFDIAVDDLGNSYTTGFFSGTVDFDPGSGTTNLVSAGSSDVFVWKLDAGGALAFARRVGSTDAEQANGIALAAGGTVHVTGYFGDTIDFDPGSGTFNMTGVGSDVFIFKLAGHEYASVVPARLMDTRAGALTVDGLFQGIGIRAAGSTTELQVTGRAGVAADSAAVALNITVTGAIQDGYVTVYPCGATQPNASNLNFVAGDTIPNLVITQIGSGGKVCVFTSGATQLIADLNGFYPVGSAYAPLVPGRLLDSRTPASPTVDGTFEAIGVRAAGSTTQLQVTGRHGVPVDALAVVLNVTATAALNDGFVTVYPCGATQPNASNLNFLTGDTIPNLVITQVGVGGKVCLFTSGDTHLIADVGGYYPATANYTPLVPGRLLDSRTPASPTVDGTFEAIGVRAAGTTTDLQVIGRHGVPADADTAVLNITVTAPTDAGYMTVYPCGAAQPNASNLNFAAGDTIANLVITRIGVGGKVCLFTSANTHLIADINGHYTVSTG